MTHENLKEELSNLPSKILIESPLYCAKTAKQTLSEALKCLLEVTEQQQLLMLQIAVDDKDLK